MIFGYGRKYSSFDDKMLINFCLKQNFLKLFSRQIPRVKQWQNGLGVHDRWSVSHRFTWNFALKPVTPTLSLEWNINMFVHRVSCLNRKFCAMPTWLASSYLCGRSNFLLSRPLWLPQAPSGNRFLPLGNQIEPSMLSQIISCWD